MTDRGFAGRRNIVWWTGLLFMIGSSCFALGAAPGYASMVPAAVVGITFFVGSIFFTSAGYLQFLQSINGSETVLEEHGWRWFAAQPDRVDWWACAVQSVGTLWFNVNTFNAMKTGLTVREQNLHIWGPDFIGSICFLVASAFAIAEVRQSSPRFHSSETRWRIAALNMLGSIFFMASAIAAYVRPSTETLLDATIANGGTFLGAVCFFLGARLLLRPDDVAAAITPTG